MAKETTAQTNFNGGEISPQALGRFDLEKWPNSMQLVENYALYKLGGMRLRPGTRYVAETKDSTKKSVLAIFSYSIEQTYVVEMGDQYFRFFAVGGVVLSAGVPVEVVTPYLEAHLRELHFAQDADTFYITHRSYAPRKLTRTSATSFNLALVNFVRGPFLDTNITATTISADADTGTGITLTASAAIFQAGHVGSLWRVDDGVVKITAFTDSTHVDGDVQAEPDGTAGDLNNGASPSTDWAEGAFSAVRGYPASCTFNALRLWYASTTYQANTEWGSYVGIYDSFLIEDPITDSSAITAKVAADKVSTIRWLSSMSGALIPGSAGGTFSTSGGSIGQGLAITSENINNQKDTTYGVSQNQPCRNSSYLYYLQRSKFILRELTYNYISNSQISQDMNQLADHVLRDGQGAIDLDQQQSPDDRIWCLRADGQIAILSRNPEEKVLGWHRYKSQTSDGIQSIFESVAIEERDGEDDRIWVVVKRKINGNWKRYVEYFTDEYWRDIWDAVKVDCSLTRDTPITIVATTQSNPVVVNAPAHGIPDGTQVKITGVEGMTELNNRVFLTDAATTDTFQLTDLDGNAIDGTEYGAYLQGGEVRTMVDTVTGLGHLEGQTVHVQVDGNVPAEQETYTVVSGSITLRKKAAVIHVGLFTRAVARMLPPSGGSPYGTGQTKKRRVYHSCFRVHNSFGFKVGLSLDKLSPIHIQTAGDVVGEFRQPVSDDLEAHFESEWNRRPGVYIVQDKPLETMILAAVVRSELEEVV